MKKIPPAVENETAPGGIFMCSVSAGAVFLRRTTPSLGSLSAGIKKMQENFLHRSLVARGGFEPSTLRV